MDTTDTIDVTVVGAGPVGLLIAAELALAGVGVQVIERLPTADPTVKAGSINVATAEILDRRGLLPAASQAHDRMAAEVARFAEGQGAHLPTPGQAEFPVAGHFAAMFFRPDLVEQNDPELRAHTAIAGATLVAQRDVEAMLADHAAGLGVPVRRGIEVTDMQQDESGVTLQTTGGPLRTRWLVGADGGRSVVRKLAGIDFVGTDPETTGYQAIADLEGTEPLKPGWTWTPDGVYCFGPIPGRILTVQFTGPPADRSKPVTAEEVQASIRLVSGHDVTVKALHGNATRWTDNARQAETYRRGRVLLAGDAAHVHSPFSGQGLNLGIGDAINLGWKLAATVRGRAPQGLLDSYHDERHAIGAWVLDWTRAQVALMRGDAKTGQLRAAVQEQMLGTSQAMMRVVKLTSGIAQYYSPDGGTPATGVRLDPPAGAGYGVGRLLGDIYLTDGGRLADHAHRGGFVLLDRTRSGAFGETASAWRDRVDIVNDERADDRACPLGLLVRPDGVIVWASTTDTSDTASLDEALRRWAGAPMTGGDSR